MVYVDIPGTGRMYKHTKNDLLNGWVALKRY